MLVTSFLVQFVNISLRFYNKRTSQTGSPSSKALFLDHYFFISESAITTRFPPDCMAIWSEASAV